MAKSESNQSKSAAPTTPAAPLPESQSGADQDALAASGAERGDIYGIQDALNAELGLLSESQTDENPRARDDDADDTANLDAYDEDAAAEAAAEITDQADSEAQPEADPDAETEEAAEAEATDDDAKAAEAAKSPEEEAAKDAEKRPNERLQARIDELTAARKSAEEQLAQASEKLAAYRARDEGRLSPDVLEHIDSPEDLTSTKQRYNALLTWAIKHPEGGKLGEQEFDAEQVRELHAEAQNLLSEAIPARERYLQQRTQAEAVAVNAYPWLKDTTKGAGALVHQAIQSEPALRRLPAYRLLAADALIGQAFRTHGIAVTDKLLGRLIEETKREAAAGKAKPPAAAKPAPAARPPAAPARAGVLPPRQTPRAAAAKVAGQRLRVSAGTEDDLAAYIADQL